MAGKFIIRSLALGITLLSIASGPFFSSEWKRTRPASSEQGSPIQDPFLQEGWNNLRSHQELIQLPNGDVISGQVLADFILNNQIPVVWGSQDICGGGSCSIMYCGPEGNCSYENGQPGIEPIYINPSVQTQGVGRMARLTQELGHETFHRMQYFGLKSDSQLEEYWAFYVGAQIVQADWPKFDGVDPQDPEQLQMWFKIHALNGYLDLPLYPGDPAPSFQKIEGNLTLINTQGK
jgi:hypothetical protein